MKRILIVGFTANPGGIENVIMNYYRNINRSKIQFDFLKNTEVMAFEEEIISMQGKVYKICSRTKNYRKYKKDLKEFFIKHAKEYSAIWVNFCNLTNLDYLKYAKKNGIKCRIIHSHNSQNMSSKIHLIAHKINKIFLTKYATDYWACSEEAGKWFFYEKIRKSNNYRIINNAIDTERFKFDENIRKDERDKLELQGKFVIGNIGRFHFQKNHSFIIDVFEEITKIKENVVLILVGTGELELDIKKKVNDLNLSEKVIFLGKRDDVEKVIQVFDVLLFPSLFEGLPLTLVEAQVNGVPIFASKDVIPNQVKMSENLNFISLSQSPKEWAKCIVDKYNKNQIIRTNNLENIRKNGYDISQEAKKIEEYLERE